MATHTNYEFFEKEVLSVKEYLVFDMEDIFKQIYRKISLKQTVRFPWGFSIERKCHKAPISSWFKAVRHHRTLFGFHITEKRDSKQNLKSIAISFHHHGSLKFHVGKILDISPYLSKSLKNDCMGNVVVGEEKPFSIEYICSRRTLKVTGYFEVKSSYGYTISV